MTHLFNENNWYRWSYSGGPDFGLRNGPQDKLYVHYGQLPQMKDFRTALLDNAKSVIDHFPGERMNLLVSGGMDSDLVLRTYKALGHPIEAHIFRYEKDWNIYDVSHAIVLCENLGVPYKLHDFNLKNFFENNAVRMSQLAQCDRPRALVQLAFLDQLDGLPVSASADPRWYRPHDDYSVRAHWVCQDFEHDIAMDRYAHRVGRPAVMQWFKWTPALTLAWFTLQWFGKLVNDQYPGKLGVVSTKIEGYREVYPEMVSKTKRTGFESIDHLVDPVVAYLAELNGGLHYRQYYSMDADALWRRMTGEPYYGGLA